MTTSGTARFGVPFGLPTFVALTASTVVMTNLVHEAGHALAAKSLGYRVFVNINSSGNVPDGYRSVAHSLITDAAGPLTTIAVAVIALLWMRRSASPVLLTVIFCALAMRLLAAVASLTGPNDEARIGMAFDLGYWTVHIASVAILLALFVVAFGLQPQRWTWFAVSIPVVIASVVAIVIGEQSIPPLVF